MSDTFDWRVHATASGGGEFTTVRSQFGDGYSQEAAWGINPDIQKWNVTVSGKRAYLEDILTFIRSHIGISFNWTPPLGDEGLYRCKRYSISDQGAAYFTLNMEFEQTYAP